MRLPVTSLTHPGRSRQEGARSWECNGADFMGSAKGQRGVCKKCARRAQRTGEEDAGKCEGSAEGARGPAGREEVSRRVSVGLAPGQGSWGAPARAGGTWRWELRARRSLPGSPSVPARPGQDFPQPGFPPGPGRVSPPAGAGSSAAPLPLAEAGTGRERSGGTPEARVAAPELWDRERGQNS